MDDDQAPKPSNGAAADQPHARSRWTPKPEQILILESIFNSGMVNPPKDETVRIRKLLQRFGSVGDANVFYWFQNRRSRSRRRQRQLQASLALAAGATSLYEPAAASPNSSASAGHSFTPSSSSTAGFVSDHESSSDDLFAVSRQMGFRDNTPTCFSYGSEQRQYQHGCSVTVFINGIPLEIQRGPIDMTSVFGHEALLVHSSGEVLPVNEHGILMQNLQMGESYFLIERSEKREQGGPQHHP